MRRSLILTSVLAVSTAVLGACESQKPESPKPPATPSATATATPVASPSASPVTSPTKPGSTPEVKKADDKGVNKDAKPLVTGTPKAK